jgi:hypothetical protein
MPGTAKTTAQGSLGAGHDKCWEVGERQDLGLLIVGQLRQCGLHRTADIVGPGTQPDTPHEDETAHPRRGDRDELAPQCRLGHAAGTHAADRYGVLRER